MKILKQIDKHITKFNGVILHIRTRFIVGIALLFGAMPLLFVFAVYTNHSIDEALLSWVTSMRTPALDSVAIMVTALGGYLLLPLTLLVMCFLLYRRQYLYAVLFVIGGINAYALKAFLKLVFHRDRPIIFESLVHEQSFSYPSGHAFAATVFWGFIVWLMLKHIRQPWLRWLLIISTIVLVFAIGISRVYLGVHWPSDVFAGWVLGVWWLYFILGFAHDVERWRR